MKKRIFTLCLLAFLCAALPACALAERVFDRADLFTPAEERELEAQIEAFQQSTGMDFVLLTSAEAHSGNSQQQISDEFYDLGGFGLDEDHSGVLYFIDMAERTPYLSTTGAMIDYLTDERIDDAHERCWNYLSRGEYASAASRMVDTVQRYVQSGIPEGQYRYDVVTGRRLTARHKAITPMELVVSLAIALAVAAGWALTVQSRYLLKGSTYQYDYRGQSRVSIRGRVDDYLRTTSVRTRKAEPPQGGGGGVGGGGGSGVHTSSSGTSHGGGAGRSF